jgi:hypothetical protein
MPRSSETKRAKIEDLLTFINDRLSELEEEKEELKQFQVSTTFESHPP